MRLPHTPRFTKHAPLIAAVSASLLLFGLLVALAPPSIDERAPRPVPAPAVDNQAPDAVAAGDAERYFGYTPDPQGTERFLKSLPKPFMAQAAPQLLQAQDDTTVLLYRALYEAYAAHSNGQQWIVGAQGIGDCVSWGWAHGADIHLAVLWKLGESSEWKAAATEAIYGGSRCEARGRSYAGMRDGSYGAAAAKWVIGDVGGIVFRQPYPELSIDLSQYSASRAKNWGAYGCGGQADNGRLDAIGKKHPIRDVVLVTTFQEAAAAIQSGYPVAVCSGQGFANHRDAQGFAAARGSWAHCMVFIGVRFDRPGLLCLNSWGPRWIGGPKWPSDQPDGSFWVDARVADRMLSGRDSFAISGYRGFPLRNLKHGEWVEVRPQQVQRIERRIASRWLDPALENQFSLAP
jgi:hypothetical protein